MTVVFVTRVSALSGRGRDQSNAWSLFEGDTILRMVSVFHWNGFQSTSLTTLDPYLFPLIGAVQRLHMKCHALDAVNC